MISCVDLLRSITTVTFSPGLCGNSMLCTVPLWTPPTLTSPPASNPATFSNCAFTWYVELNRYCLLPMTKTPTTRMASVATINAPNALLLTYLLLRMLYKLTNQLVVACMKFLKGAFEHNTALIEQNQTIRNCPALCRSCVTTMDAM